ncbi:CinA family protein [Neptuniibacter sp. CAU 1671]|jgi:nicotinamide-nucleotide amidase|uniref:CinA family protein n=1 Tax=Neptuniibacter sp. CAU 1671 TaxID=3032593 RepID=UPI0023DA3641|nr:CinA family protein [Neptuniibacter sp. CAU 1671]MDF2181799.1 CinA family protein [Neptuniibacter sp. CAU 1671]
MFDLATKTGARLQEVGAILATAESCTGGGVAATITSIAGSSAWFDCGFVTYSNQSKTRLLGVQTDTLEQYGAVSEPVVTEMAEGALARSNATITVAISGIAGPDGGSADKPVGTVWFAWAVQGKPTVTSLCFFSGDRTEIQQQAVTQALEGVLAYLPV